MMVNEIVGTKLYQRVRLLSAMDFIVRHLNHEEGEEWWLMEGVPDGATIEDYVAIAVDEDLFIQCEDVFYETVKTFGRDRWYVG